MEPPKPKKKITAREFLDNWENDKNEKKQSKRKSKNKDKTDAKSENEESQEQGKEDTEDAVEEDTEDAVETEENNQDDQPKDEETEEGTDISETKLEKEVPISPKTKENKFATLSFRILNKQYVEFEDLIKNMGITKQEFLYKAFNKAMEEQAQVVENKIKELMELQKRLEAKKE